MPLPSLQAGLIDIDRAPATFKLLTFTDEQFAVNIQKQYRNQPESLAGYTYLMELNVGTAMVDSAGSIRAIQVREEVDAASSGLQIATVDDAQGVFQLLLPPSGALDADVTFGATQLPCQIISIVARDSAGVRQRSMRVVRAFRANSGTPAGSTVTFPDAIKTAADIDFVWETALDADQGPPAVINQGGTEQDNVARAAAAAAQRTATAAQTTATANATKLAGIEDGAEVNPTDLTGLEIPTWQQRTAYPAGQLVKHTGNRIYSSINAIDDQQVAGPDGDQTNWEALDTYVGDWAVGYYVEGQVVSSNGRLYIATQDVTNSDTARPEADDTHWVPISNSPTEIKDALETLTGSNRLDASAIKNSLPTYPPSGSRNGLVPKFQGDVLGWRQDAQGTATGGLASVSSDATITGDGTSGDPLAVANPFTAADETKLDGIETGAEVNVQADWSETDDTADSYIENKPTIPTAAGTSSAISTRLAAVEAKTQDLSLPTPATGFANVTSAATASIAAYTGTIATESADDLQVLARAIAAGDWAVTLGTLNSQYLFVRIPHDADPRNYQILDTPSVHGFQPARLPVSGFVRAGDSADANPTYDYYLSRGTLANDAALTLQATDSSAHHDTTEFSGDVTGTLDPDVVNTAAIQDNAVTEPKLSSGVRTKLNAMSGGTAFSIGGLPDTAVVAPASDQIAVNDVSDNGGTMKRIELQDAVRQALNDDIVLDLAQASRATADRGKFLGTSATDQNALALLDAPEGGGTASPWALTRSLYIERNGSDGLTTGAVTSVIDDADGTAQSEANNNAQSGLLLYIDTGAAHTVAIDPDGGYEYGDAAIGVLVASGTPSVTVTVEGDPLAVVRENEFVHVFFDSDNAGVWQVYTTNRRDNLLLIEDSLPAPGLYLTGQRVRVGANEYELTSGVANNLTATIGRQTFGGGLNNRYGFVSHALANIDISLPELGTVLHNPTVASGGSLVQAMTVLRQGTGNPSTFSAYALVDGAEYARAKGSAAAANDPLRVTANDGNSAVTLQLRRQTAVVTVGGVDYLAFSVEASQNPGQTSTTIFRFWDLVSGANGDDVDFLFNASPRGSAANNLVGTERGWTARPNEAVESINDRIDHLTSVVNRNVELLSANSLDPSGTVWSSVDSSAQVGLYDTGSQATLALVTTALSQDSFDEGDLSFPDDVTRWIYVVVPHGMGGNYRIRYDHEDGTSSYVRVSTLWNLGNGTVSGNLVTFFGDYGAPSVTPAIAGIDLEVSTTVEEPSYNGNLGSRTVQMVTQAQYDAITTKEPVFYIITDAS